MSEKNSGSVHPRRRLFVALVVAIVLVTVAAVVLPGWRARQVPKVEEQPQPLTEQEVAEVKAAVEKETGTTVRYVGGNRQGTVEVFTGGLGEQGFAYRVKKIEGRWRVVEKFMAFFA